jgi:ribosomal-protein-alanine N-acetyltransferase
MSVRKPPVLTFVPLAEEHLTAILAIEVEAYPEPWSRGMFYDELRNNRSYFFVALDSAGTVTGYAGFWLVLDEAHVTSVAVRSDERGRGAGREILAYLLARAQEAGARMATLEVRESNEAARALYADFGFLDVGRRKGYYPSTNEDAVLMLKEFVDIGA